MEWRFGGKDGGVEVNGEKAYDLCCNDWGGGFLFAFSSAGANAKNRLSPTFELTKGAEGICRLGTSAGSLRIMR